ncbi:MAG: antibiotic biosynthesis monooxygenase [Planctomycetaceae bacterium]|nr:antibiotic biosynthesis monooxygenase [Planctomycetaceae bacterium]
MANLTIVASITAKADQVEFVKSELFKLVEKTRAEEGCVQYDLHQDHNHPHQFLFFENWTTRELWQAHIASQHIADYKAATADAIESVIISEMTQIA